MHLSEIKRKCEEHVARRDAGIPPVNKDLAVHFHYKGSSLCATYSLYPKITKTVEEVTCHRCLGRFAKGFHND